MKIKLLDALKTKFAGVDAKILDRIAEKLAKTVNSEDDVKTAVEGVTFQQILDSYGDFRANGAQKSAIENYEKKYNLKDGKVVKTETGGGGTGDEEPAWFKKYREESEARIAAIESERKATERMKLISDTAKELGIPEFMLKRLNIADDADVKAELTSLKQDLVTNNLLPETSGGGKGESDAQLKADADKWADGL